MLVVDVQGGPQQTVQFRNAATILVTAGRTREAFHCVGSLRPGVVSIALIAPEKCAKPFFSVVTWHNFILVDL